MKGGVFSRPRGDFDFMVMPIPHTHEHTHTTKHTSSRLEQRDAAQVRVVLEHLDHLLARQRARGAVHTLRLGERGRTVARERTEALAHGAHRVVRVLRDAVEYEHLRQPG